MKKIILIIAAFLVFGCGEKDTDKNNKPLPKATVSRAANTSYFKTESQTQKRQIEKTTSCSANQIVSNANLFRESIKPKKSKLMEGIYIPKLTMKQAEYLLKNGTSQWFNIASNVSIKCRNFEAGNYFFENVYEICKLNGKSLSGIGSLWGEFLMRHGKGREAIEIFDMTIKNSINNNERPESISVAMNDKVNTYNMMRDFKNALVAAEDSFEYSLKHIDNQGMNWQFPISVELYFRELYNNEMFDEGLNAYYQYKDKLNTKEGKLTDWENTWVKRLKKRYKFKHTVSQGYGVLAK